MARKVFEVDDGCTYLIAAEDHAQARELWAQQMIEYGGCDTMAEVVSDYGDPDIRTIQPEELAGRQIQSDSEEDSCPKCGGRGKVPHFDSALKVFTDDEAADPKKRAKNGVLSCSEW